MGKQSARLYYQGKDHKDIFFNGKYHSAMYKGNELLWEKYVNGKWVYDRQYVINDFRIETLEPIKKEIENQATTNAGNMTHNSQCYIVYTQYALAHHSQGLYISNVGGNRLTGCTDLITIDFRFAVALNDRILICDNGINGIIYEAQYNKESKKYNLVKIYSDRLPGEENETTYYKYSPYITGRHGEFLIGYHSSTDKYIWTAFGKDNIFHEFATMQSATNFCCCQDDHKVYLLVYIRQSYSPYLSYPVVYVYDGNSTTTLHPDFGGRFTNNVAMIKRNGKFIIYETHDDGRSNYYVDIYVTSDFQNFRTIQFKKCTIPFDGGFSVSTINGNRIYKKVAFVDDTSRVDVDDDTYKMILPISEIKKQIPVYYENGEINDNREDLCFSFDISGFLHRTFLVAYLDNLYFDDSEGNFGR